MIEVGSRARELPAPPSVVWDSLVNPRAPGTRQWLDLLPDEVAPCVLKADEPTSVVWSSLWASRPNDVVVRELTEEQGETRLKFTLLTPDDAPDESKTGHLRRRINQLLFVDLRFSYGR